MILNKVYRSVGVLSLATIIAQLINIFFIPILSRIYSVENFDTLALVIGIVSILMVFSGLRFDLLIVRSETIRKAKSLFSISILFSVFFCFFVFLFGELVLSYYLVKTKGLWLLISAIVFFYNFYNNLYSLYVREEFYLEIARSRIIQVVSSNAIQLVFVFFSFENFGLIYGYLSVFAVGSTYLLLGLNKVGFKDFFSLNSMLVEFKGNFSLARSSIVEGGAEISGYQLPILIVAVYSLSNEAAYLFMALKILNIPLSVIAQPYSSVFYKEGVKSFSEGKYKELLNKHLLISVIVALPLISMLSVFLYFFIPFFLGESWFETAKITLYMAPVTATSFLTVIFCRTFYITNRLKMLAKIQIIGFFIRVVPVLFFAVFYVDKIVFSYVVSSFVYYVLFLIVIYKDGRA